MTNYIDKLFLLPFQTILILFILHNTHKNNYIPEQISGPWGANEMSFESKTTAGDLYSLQQTFHQSAFKGKLLLGRASSKNMGFLYPFYIGKAYK